MQKTHSETITKVTAVLPVVSSAETVAFFEQAGFETTVAVPDPAGGDGPGFAILVNGSHEVMVQTHSSILDDAPSFKPLVSGQPSFLFIQVTDLADIEARFKDLTPVLEKRKTCYGALEIGYREPGGHIVVFAQFDEGALNT